MAFPFYKSLDGYIIDELRARTSNNNVKLSKLVPWIKATSSLEGRYSLGTDTYSTLFDGSASDAYGNSQGSAWKYRPNPIVTDFSVDFASRGTLRRCTLKIKCFSPDQLTKVQKYFMEPGLSVFVQWGWNYSVNKGKQIGPVGIDAGTVQNYHRNAAALNTIRSNNDGCYDNFVGIITGGDSSISGNEFEVTVKMASIGEILMGKSNEDVVKEGDDENSLKPRNHSKYYAMSNGSATGTIKNWIYCYQQLPDELRTDSTEKIDVKPESDFINYIEELTEEAKTETSDSGWFTGTLTFKGVTFTAADSESPINSNKFISFDAFIKLLNSKRIQFQPNSTINFDIDISDAYCGAFLRMFSTSERVFIPNKSTYNYLNDVEILGGNFAGNLDTSVNGRSFVKTSPTTLNIDGTSATLVGYRHGWIGDLYIDNELAMEALKDQKTPVKEILDNVLKTMEEAVEGLWAFQIVERKNGDSVSLRIADANLRNVRTGNAASPPQFDMFGTDSFFVDASFNLDIPKSMASQVFLEKSAAGVQSTDALTKGVFSDKKDVVLADLILEDIKNNTSDSSGPAPEELKWIEFRRNIRIMIKPSVTHISTIGNANMDEWAMCGQYLNKRKFNDIRKIDLGYTSPSTEVYNGRPLPVSFDFSILGMSGFQVGHLFNIKGLPPQYNSDKGAFQVEEIKHKIDGKQWITEISSHFRPFHK